MLNHSMQAGILILFWVLGWELCVSPLSLAHAALFQPLDFQAYPAEEQTIHIGKLVLID